MIDEQVAPIESTVQSQPEISEREAKIQYDFAALRKSKEESDRKVQEYERILQQQQAQKQPEAVHEEDDLNIDNEDYVQAKHIKNSTKNLKKELNSTKKELQDLKQTLSYLEAKVDTDGLKDFESTVNDESLRKLAEKYPTDYKTMMLNPNLRERSRTAYNMIRNYGITETDTSRIDKRIEENRQKPQLASLTSPQQPTSTLGKFTDDGRRIMDEGERDRILRELERKKMSW